MRCGTCDCAITAQEKFKRQKNGNVHHYIHYRCTKKKGRCPERYLELRDFNKQVDAIIAKLTISERFQKWALQYLHEVRKEEAVTREVTIAGKHKEYERITLQLGNLLMKYTSPENVHGELVSEQEYTTLRSSLLKEKANYEAEFNARGREIEEWVELSERTFNFARYARMWFTQGDIETKRAIFACLGSDLLLKDRKVILTLHKPFQFIFDGAKKAEEELRRFEPLKLTVGSINSRYFAQRFPVLSIFTTRREPVL